MKNFIRWVLRLKPKPDYDKMLIDANNRISQLIEENSNLKKAHKILDHRDLSWVACSGTIYQFPKMEIVYD